jgi:hypothetical protein
MVATLFLLGRMTTYSFQSRAILQRSQCSTIRQKSRSLSLLAKQNPEDTEKPVFRLLNGVLSRAERTLSYKSTIEKDEGVKEPYTEAATDAIQDVLSSVQQNIAPTPTPTPAPDVLPRPTDIGLNYNKNPTITSTALAHSLWSYVLRPGIDTAIDATAGNGGDSMALAQMLFSETFSDNSQSQSQLVCIDIQSEACENTRKGLAGILPAEILEKNVQILNQSHAPLAMPLDTSSIALVVYNLGFLPGNNTKECMTTTESTIASMADALLMIRVGGLLSVMTYPRTNKPEDFAVHAFLEGLALFTSEQLSWETFIDGLDCSESLRDRLKVTLQHVRQEGDAYQTWRVHEHKKIGWIDAPILLTATRIK